MSLRRDTLAGPGWGIPDLAVILSGGGARAAYQVGVLAAIAEQMPTLQIPIITGVSAGAINAAFLAAYTGQLDRGVAELRGQWLRLTADQVYSLPTKGIAATAFRMMRSAARRLRRREGVPAVRGLLDMRPLARFLEGIMHFEGIGRNIQAGRLKALALSSTSYDNGKTVTFVQARPDIPVWERAQRVALRTDIGLKHVMASSAIPIIFPAVKLDGGFFGDGSVRLTAPLAPAIHLGAGRLLTIGMRSTAPPHYELPPENAEYPSAAAIGALLLHSVFLDALDADVERLERLNRLLRILPPGGAPDGLKPVDVYLVRPSRDLGEMARGYWPRLPLLMDFLVRSMGIHEERGADFLSYLLFEPDYHGLLMELGHEDALAQWDRLGEFLEGGERR